MDIKADKYSGVMLFVAWAMLLILVVYITGYNGLYGQDSHEYLRYCKAIVHFLSGGGHPGSYFWTVNYPAMGALLAFITGPEAALQLLSILAASWIMVMLYQVLLHEFPGREREIIFYVVVFLGCSPYMFRYSVSAMSDFMAIGLMVGGYHNLYFSNKNEKPELAYPALLFLVFAFFTRFALLPLLAPAVGYAVFRIFRNFKPFLFSMIVLASLVPVIVHFYFKQGTAGTIFNHFLIADWSFMNYFSNSFETIDGYTKFVVPNIIYVFSFLAHPGFLFPGLLFAIILIFKRGQPVLMNPLIILAIILYVGFVAGLPGRNMRYLLPLLPLWLFVAFPAFLSISAWLFKRKSLTVTVAFVVVMFQVVLQQRAFQPFLNYNRIEKRLAGKIMELNPRVLYTFAVDGAMRSYGYAGTIVNLWYEPLNRVEGPSMMLFNRRAFETQWKNGNPMRNYHLIVDSAHARLSFVLDSGWEIYEIEKAYPDTDPGVSRIR